MELSKYIKKKVRVDLVNGFYYMGDVISGDDDCIEIKDKFGNFVSLTKEAILFIREVKRW